MFRVLRRKTVIAVGVLALASFAGGAIAATQDTSDPREAFLSDLASRLHVTVPQLTSAIKGADLDALNRAVASGRLTPSEAKLIRQRIRSGESVPLGGLISAPGYVRARIFQVRLTGLHGPPRLGSYGVVLRYLGISTSKLFSDMRAGTTLAQIAASNGKTTTGLEHVILAAQRVRLERLQAAKAITRADAHKRLDSFKRRLSSLVTSRDPLAAFFSPRVARGQVLMGGSAR